MNCPIRHAGNILCLDLGSHFIVCSFIKSLLSDESYLMKGQNLGDREGSGLAYGDEENIELMTILQGMLWKVWPAIR